MEPGDIIKFKPPKKIAGAINALKLAKRMEARIGNRTGLILEVRNNNAVTIFEDEIIVVHVMFLEVINETT